MNHFATWLFAILFIVFITYTIGYRINANETERSPEYAIGAYGWDFAETVARQPYIIRAENKEVICYVFVNLGGLSCKWKE